MTLADLERLIASQAPGSLLPRDWLLEHIRTVDAGDTDELGDLSVQEAGEILGRSASTIRSYCRGALLPGAYRQRGREWRVPHAAIRSFQRTEAEPEDRQRGPRRVEDVDLGSWREEVA